MATRPIIQTNLRLAPPLRRRFDSFCKRRGWNRPVAIERLLDLAEASETPTPQPLARSAAES